jgi:hypothetical protein
MSFEEKIFEEFQVDEKYINYSNQLLTKLLVKYSEDEIKNYAEKYLKTVKYPNFKYFCENITNYIGEKKKIEDDEIKAVSLLKNVMFDVGGKKNILILTNPPEFQQSLIEKVLNVFNSLQNVKILNIGTITWELLQTILTDIYIEYREIKKGFRIDDILDKDLIISYIPSFLEKNKIFFQNFKII